MLGVVTSMLLVVTAFGQDRSGPQPTTAEAKLGATDWLARAEQAARKVPNKDPARPRDLALFLVGMDWSKHGDVKSAERIAKDLPEVDRSDVLFFVPVFLADQGRVEEAINYPIMKQPGAPHMFVLPMCSKTDLPRALRAAAALAPPLHDNVLVDVVRTLLQEGDLPGARKAAEPVRGEESRQSAARWLNAAMLLEKPGDLKQASRQLGVDPAEIEYQIERVFSAWLAKGRLKQL